MLRVIKSTSPMSLGSWALVGFSVTSTATAPCNSWPTGCAAPGCVGSPGSRNCRRRSPVGSWAPIPRPCCPPPARRSGRRRRRALRCGYASSAVASAAAALRLGERDNRRRRDLDSIAVAALAVELAATLASDDAQRQAGIDEAPHGQTTLRTTAPLVLLLTSLLLPGRLGRTLSAVGSLALLGDGVGDAHSRAAARRPIGEAAASQPPFRAAGQSAAAGDTIEGPLGSDSPVELLS